MKKLHFKIALFALILTCLFGCSQEKCALCQAPFELIIEERIYLDGSKQYFIKSKNKECQIKIDEAHPYAHYGDAKLEADNYYKQYKKITCDEIIEHEYKPE